MNNDSSIDSERLRRDYEDEDQQHVGSRYNWFTAPQKQVTGSQQSITISVKNFDEIEGKKSSQRIIEGNFKRSQKEQRLTAIEVSQKTTKD